MKQAFLRYVSVFVLVSTLAFTVSLNTARAATICTPATSISVPFTKDGAGDFCYQSTSLCTYVNSWNMTALEINGTSYTNQYIQASSVSPVNGTYTIHYVGPYAWSHLEIAGTCGSSPTNTTTRTPTVTSTRTVTATFTNTATRTNTPTITSTRATNTPTITPTRTNTPTITNTASSTATSGPSTGLKVQYKASDINATDNQVKPHFTIVNGGTNSVSMSGLKIRYYFSENTAQAFSTYCDYAVVSCASVTTSIVSISPVTGADHYLEVGFTGGSIPAGGNSGEIQTRFNKNDWSNFNESDDYSFDPTKTAFTDWSQVALYNNGVLVWGVAAGGTPPGPTNTPTITPTPQPAPDIHQIVNTYGRLQISNTALKDKNGNAIQLIGMDSHGLTWFPLSDLNLNNTTNINTMNQEIIFAPAQGTRFPYAASTVGNLVTQWHIQIIKATMFPYDPWNGVNAKSYENNYPAWKWYNINLVNSIVQAAIDQNIYVIIDWHAGEGNDPDPNIYWNNGHAQEFFGYMVDKWGSYPNVIYQTVNSANNVAWADVSGTPGLKTYNQNLINFIRARETANGYAPNLIIAGTPTWSQDVDTATNDPLTGNLIAYNFMWYAGTHGASIRAKADTALINLTTKAPNQTLFMSEVGTTQSNGSSGIYYSEFNTWLEWAKTKKLSWLNWSIANKEEDSAFLMPAILNNIANNEIAWRGGDGISIPEALASTGYPMRIGPWGDADYSCSGKFVKGWIWYNTSQPIPGGC